MAGTSPGWTAALGAVAFGLALLPAGYALMGGFSQPSAAWESAIWFWLIYGIPYLGSLVTLAITKEPVMAFWAAVPSVILDSVTVTLLYVAVQSDGLAGVPFLMLQPLKIVVLLPVGIYLGQRRFMRAEPSL